MKPSQCFLLAILLPGSITITGCTRQQDGHEAVETPPMQLFEKGKGLRLPEEMVRTLGVETVEVAEKSFQQRIEVSARVYQRGRGTAPARAIALLGRDEAERLTVDQVVALRPAAADFAALTGRLVRLDSQTPALGQMEALIEFPDAAGRHAAGSSLAATFVGTERKTPYAAPLSAVIQGAEGAFVYTVNGAHFVRAPIKRGAESDGWVEITDGLYTGDLVVARGGEAMWMIELCALKGGTPCCPVPKKGKEK